MLPLEPEHEDLDTALPNGRRLSEEASARGRMGASRAIREMDRAAYEDLSPMIAALSDRVL